jgi:hypothetical protein
MHDARLVSCGESVGDLTRDPERLWQRNRSASDAIRQRLSVDELEHEGSDAAAFFEPVDRGDVRMLERGEHARLALEAGEPVGIAGEDFRENLQRDVAFEPRIAREIDFAHAARTDQRLNTINADADSTRERGHIQ